LSDVVGLRIPSTDLERIKRLMAQGIGLENTEALQVCMAAYDIINNTRHSGPFTDAVNKAFTEATRGE